MVHHCASLVYLRLKEESTSFQREKTDHFQRVSSQNGFRILNSGIRRKKTMEQRLQTSRNKYFLPKTPWPAKESIKYYGGIKTISDRQGLKNICLPITLSQEATDGCATPNWENKPRKRRLEIKRIVYHHGGGVKEVPRETVGGHPDGSNALNTESPVQVDAMWLKVSAAQHPFSPKIECRVDNLIYSAYLDYMLMRFSLFSRSATWTSHFIPQKRSTPTYSWEREVGRGERRRRWYKALHSQATLPPWSLGWSH